MQMSFIQSVETSDISVPQEKTTTEALKKSLARSPSSADPLATPEGGDSHSSCRKTNFPKNNKGNRKKLNTNECIKRKRKRVFYSLRRHGHSHLPSRPPRDGKHKNPFNCKDGEERDKIDEKRKKGESKGKDFHKGSKLADVVIMLLFFVFVCVSFSRDARVTP